MTVVNLPTDTRWGDLGKGLGGIGAAVLGGIAQKQIADGVSQIMQDPSVSETDKGVQALKKFGNPGYQVYQNLVKTQVLQGQLKEALASAGLNTVRATVAQSTLPGTVAEQQARVNLMGAQTGQTQAATQLDTAKLPLVAGQVAQTAATTEKTNVEAAVGKLKYEQLQTALDQQKAMLEGGQTTLDGALKGMGIDPASPAGMAAKNAYAMEPDLSKKSSAFSKVVNNYISQKTRADITANAPKQTPEPQIKAASQSVEEATSAERFADDFLKGGAGQLGALKGATFKTLAERYGLPTGDQTLVDMWNASYQQVASAATQGGGFFAQGRVKLAKDVTPGIAETPLHAALALDQVADRQIANLQAQRSGLAPNQATAPLDAAIAKWQSVKTKLDLQSDVVKDPTTSQDRTVLYVGGSQVDPKSFEKLVDGSRTYKFKDGSTVTGTNLIAMARKVGVAPDTGLAKLESQHGGLAGQ